MYTELEFTNDFIRAYPTYKRSDRSAKSIGLCYQTYLSSSRAALEALVVGRIVKKGQSIDEPPMIGLDDVERFNFGTTSDRTQGSVLWSQYWSIPLNDSWLMGGIHAGLPFYVASPRTQGNILDPQWGITVTGRELLGLTTFGYELNPNTTLGEVYECQNPAKASRATFMEYELTFRQALRSEGWKRLIG